MIATLRPEIADALAAADRLVRPWLAEGDTWRMRDGLPELDDVLVALRRVRGVKEIRLEHTFHRYTHVVSERGSREAFEAETYPEAVLLLLADDLRRTCAICRECDGHDVRCPALAEEEVA